MGIDRGAKLAALKEQVPPEFKPENAKTLPDMAQDHAQVRGSARPVAEAAPAQENAAPVNAGLKPNTPDAGQPEEKAPAQKPVQESPAAGSDDDLGAPSYKKAADKQAEIQAEKLKTIDNLALGAQEKGDAAPIINGHLASGSRGSAAMERIASEDQEKKKEKDNSFMRHLLWLQNHIAGLENQLEFWQGEYEKYSAQEQALEKYIEGLESGNKADMSNEEQRHIDDAIKAYEGKYGVKVDRNDTASMRDILRESRDKKAHAEHKVGETKQKIEKSKDLLDRYQKNPDDPEVQKEIKKLEDSAEGQEVSDKAVTDVDSSEQRRTMNEAAGFSKARVDQLVTAAEDADAFFSDSPAQTASAASSIDPAGIKTNGEIENLGRDFKQAAAQTNTDKPADLASEQQQSTPDKASGPSATA